MKTRKIIGAWIGFVVLCGVMGMAQAAKTYPADCPGMTLQQCVDSDNGGTGNFFIYVEPGTYTGQNVQAFNRSGTIMAAPGNLSRPVFVDSVWAWDVVGNGISQVRGLKFTGNSRVNLWFTGTVASGEAGRVVIEDNVFEVNTVVRSPVRVEDVNSSGPGVRHVVIRRNDISHNGSSTLLDSSGLIRIGPMNNDLLTRVAIYENRLQTSRSDLPGLLVMHDTADLNLLVSQNEFRGARGIHLVDGPATDTMGRLLFYAFYNLFSDRFENGVWPVAVNEQFKSELKATYPAELTLGFYNNTFDGAWDLIDLTGHAPTASGTHSLLVHDNIFAGTTNTCVQDGSGNGISLSNSRNLRQPGIFSCDYTAAASDQTAEPRFVAAPARYALRADSPAIEMAANADFSFSVIQWALLGSDFFYFPSYVDLDGHRRTIDADGDGSANADAGAYEFGDRMIVHEVSANNIHPVYPHVSFVHNSGLSSDSDAVGLFTHLYDYEDTPGATHDATVGWWRALGSWTVYNEDTSIPMPVNALFSVFHPTGDRGVDNNNFRGLLEVQNGASAAPSLDTGLTESNLVVFVRHVYQDQAGANVYDPVALEVFYDGTSWRIYHVDGSDIPANAAYVVYYQQPSRNAFKVVPGDGRAAVLLPGYGIIAPHPLLQGPAAACVTPVIQQVALLGLFGNGLGNTPKNVGYDWLFGGIYAEDGSAPFSNYDFWFGGTGYFVLVDPQQAFECADRIYKDDMDH